MPAAPVSRVRARGGSARRVSPRTLRTVPVAILLCAALVGLRPAFSGPSIGRIVVTGATGRTGRLVVKELLGSTPTTEGSPPVEVLAVVRNATKAAEVLPMDEPLLRVVNSTKEAVDAEVTGAIWCADGQDGLADLTEALARPSDTPRLVFCSSAAVTRPTWPAAKRRRLAGAADIPIVRLNPGDILGRKRDAEAAVRRSGVAYTIVRPTGLRDGPLGRPLFSQGDLAVGRTSREDLAAVLTALLREPAASGKTVEMVSVAGYPRPTSYAQALGALRKDGERRWWPWRKTDDAVYGVLQQLLPGEEQNSAALAMGQSYEQYDRGEEGRLGPRGEERAPATL